VVRQALLVQASHRKCIPACHHRRAASRAVSPLLGRRYPRRGLCRPLGVYRKDLGRRRLGSGDVRTSSCSSWKHGGVPREIESMGKSRLLGRHYQSIAGGFETHARPGAHREPGYGLQDDLGAPPA
jgi:hypothetical protein